jgi:hypothetical protein
MAQKRRESLTLLRNRNNGVHVVEYAWNEGCFCL